MKTNVKVRKPHVLISLYIRNGRRYSAGGWLAHSVGLNVADMSRSFLSRGDDVCYTDRIAQKLQELGLRVTPDDVWELDQRCDSARSEDRVELFCDWCDGHGIEVTNDL